MRKLVSLYIVILAASLTAKAIDWKNSALSQFENDSKFMLYIQKYYLPANINRVKIIDSTTTITVKTEEETYNYFYAFPPYPIPASKILKSEIYWDPSIDIDKDEISVYDINGVKVSGRETIEIIRSDSYFGYLSWDCSGFKPGIYLIQIKHGTTFHTIKAVVSR